MPYTGDLKERRAKTMSSQEKIEAQLEILRERVGKSADDYSAFGDRDKRVKK